MGFDFGKQLVARTKDRVFKKVIGGVGDFIRGIPGIGRSDDLQGDRLKRRTDHFSFPLDVEQDPGLGNQGHYILFFINEQTNAKLSFGELQDEKKGLNSVLEEAGNRSLPNYVTEIIGDRGVNKYIKKKNSGKVEGQLMEDLNKAEGDVKGVNIEVKGAEGAISYDYANVALAKNKLKAHREKYGYRGMNVKRAATRRLKTAISLYMPNDINVTYSAGYKDQEIGTLSENMLEAYSKFSAGQYGAAGQSIVEMDEGVKQLLAALLTTTVGVLPGMGGIKELYEMREGKIFSNRMEVAFTGLEKRKFNYTFKMIPRSQKEAEEIRAIIFAFKANMLPELDGDYEKGRRMVIPNTFDIKYMYQGDENQYLNKISTCVLENLNVKYGGGTFQAFEGTEQGAPIVETEIALSFKEMETITRERIFEGF